MSVLIAAALLGAGTRAPARADDALNVLCSNGLKGAMERLVPPAERAIGRRIVVQFGSSATLRRTIESGEPFDIAIVTPQVIAELEIAGFIESGSQTHIAQTRIAVGIRAGASKADISTGAAIARRLLAATSVTYAKEGASTPAIVAMLERLGIANELKGRTVLQAISGRPAESVAEGENELVLAPLSEILMVGGVDVLGMIPGEFQQPLVMTAALGAKTQQPGPARALMAFLTSSGAADALRASGMEPISAGKDEARAIHRPAAASAPY